MSNNETNLKNQIAELGYLVIAETEKALKIHGITKSNQIEFNLWIPKTAENAEAELIKKMNQIKGNSEKMEVINETEKAVKVKFQKSYLWIPKAVFEVCSYLTEKVEQFILSKKFVEIKETLAQKETKNAILIENEWIPKSQIYKGKYIPKWLYQAKFEKVE